MTSSEINRGQLFLGFARTRLAEASALRGDRAGYSAVLDDMDSDTRQGVRLLTGAAAQRADAAPLDAVDSFVGRQRRALDALTQGASRADRERTSHSLVLLESVAERADALRTAIGCGQPATTASDHLGPTPGTCP